MWPEVWRYGVLIIDICLSDTVSKQAIPHSSYANWINIFHAQEYGNGRLLVNVLMIQEFTDSEHLIDATLIKAKPHLLLADVSLSGLLVYEEQRRRYNPN